MKLIIIIALGLIFAGCAKQNHPGFGRKMATEWAGLMGEKDPWITCTERYSPISGEGSEADCTVRVAEKLYNIECFPYVNNCFIRTR
jgi:hypothetical protein